MNLEKWKRMGIETEEIDLKDVTIPTGLSLRVSTEIQEKKESLENQEIEGLNYIKNKKYNLIKVYKDVASGGSYVRDGMNQLIDDINNDKIKRVVFVNAERLARDITFAINFSSICQEHKTIIEFIDSGKMFYKFNLMELMEYILTFFKSHAQREQISIDVKRRMATKLESGQRMGARAPYGYKWQDKTLVIIEEEARIVTQIYKDFINGETRANLSKSYGRTQNFIRRLIENPAYKGFNKFGEKHFDKKTGRWINRKEYVVVKGDHQAIIDEKTWNMANNILNSKVKPRIKNENNPKYLFSGLIYCYCGCKMLGWSSIKEDDITRYYYSCSTRNSKKDRKNCSNGSKNAEELEKLIIEELIKLSNELDIDYELENEENKVQEEINYLNNEKATLQNQRKELLKLVGVYPAETISSKAKEIDIAINRKETKIAELKKYNKNITKNDKIELNKIFKEVLSNYKDENRMELKKILPLLIERIEFVNNYRFKIILNI